MSDGAPGRPHNMILEGRKHLMLTGVEDVKSYDDSRIILLTGMGVLVIGGSGLKLNKINTENGDADIEGNITTAEYSDGVHEKGFLKKMFR